MEALIKGIVCKSIKTDPTKKYFQTAVYTRDDDIRPDIISTTKQYQTGDKISLKVRVSASLFNGKCYMNVIESEDQEAGKSSDLKAVGMK
jgi:hypothetical protein